LSKQRRRRSNSAKNLRIRNIECRKLSDGSIGFYWRSKQYGKMLGFHAEALGTDPLKAFLRAVELNQRLEAALEEHLNPKEQALTVDYMIGLYQKDFDYYEILQPKTRRGYDIDLRAVSREIGSKLITSFTPSSCHLWYVDLRKNYGLKRANVIYRMARMLFRLPVRMDLLTDNPFEKVYLRQPKKRTRAELDRNIWTRDRYNTLISKAFEMREDQLGVAAMMAYELCQRECDLIGSMQVDDDGKEYWHAALWADYDGQRLRIIQSKTDVPIYVNIAEYLPDLKLRLDALPRANAQIINYVPKKKKGQRGNLTIRPYKEDHFRRVYRKVREAAKLPPDLYFMNLRHGGLTELASLEAGDDIKQALSGHKQRGTLDRYVFHTSDMADRALQVRMKNKNFQTGTI